MSELRFETLTMPAAHVGPASVLLPLGHPENTRPAPAVSDQVPARDQEFMGYGSPSTIRPYTMMDCYDRQPKSRGLRVAVLENETLVATFLLEFGGRLWSLRHKPSGRELLHTNPCLQPANLAIRNAWFSGGVEWNIGVCGHSPFTCSSLYAARLMRDAETPVLRLYEWERIRGVPFQIDAYLPDGSSVLYVRPRITNPNPSTVPMYWWSNIATPETPGSRVLAPADHAYTFGYSARAICPVPIPIVDGIDVSIPVTAAHSVDYFFRIPDGHRPWIAAVDQGGAGLMQTSTNALKGRKLFLWGQGAGGRHWQEFLSHDGGAYIEIQAGLARTQLEHLPMPAGAEWAWLEAYGLLEVPADISHAADWLAACDAAETRIEALIPRAQLDAQFAATDTMARAAPIEVRHYGSGWGALERRRRSVMHEQPLCGRELVFPDDAMTSEQTGWVNLLSTGTFASPARSGYQVAPAWQERLERSDDKSAEAWMHLGVTRYHASDIDGACDAWRQSNAIERNAIATRNLAQAAFALDDLATAAALIQDARELAPDLPQLAIECGQILIAAGQHREWLDILERLPHMPYAKGRLRLMEGQAAMALGRLDRVSEILDCAVDVHDMREGELSLTQLWFELQAHVLAAANDSPVTDALRAEASAMQPPDALDYRMR
jgi:tetratricopeptide (TPR) repeat protein